MAMKKIPMTRIALKLIYWFSQDVCPQLHFLKRRFFREFSGYRSKKAFKPPALPGGRLQGNVAFGENVLRRNALLGGKRGLLRNPPAKPGAEIVTWAFSFPLQNMAIKIPEKLKTRRATGETRTKPSASFAQQPKFVEVFFAFRA